MAHKLLRLLHMEKDIITNKAINAALKAIESDLQKKSCGYAKMIIIRNNLAENIRRSFDEGLTQSNG